MWRAWITLLVACTSPPRPLPGDPGDGDADGCGATFVHTVTGTVHDDRGAAIAGARPQLCIRRAAGGELVCLQPPYSDAAGGFAIEVPAEVRCMSGAVMRVLLPGARRATSYCPVTLAAGVVTLPAPVILHATAPAATLPPEGDAASVRTVVFADGLEVDVVPRDYFPVSDAYAALSAVRLEADAPGLCVDGLASVLGVYAFSPEGDVDAAGFPMRIPNWLGLAPGAPLALHVQGGLACTLEDGEILDEGVWAQAGTALVSGNGAWIAGARLHCFSWLAVTNP